MAFYAGSVDLKGVIPRYIRYHAAIVGGTGVTFVTGVGLADQTKNAVAFKHGAGGAGVMAGDTVFKSL